MNISIIDYGMGNLRSVQNAIVRLSSNAIVTNNIDLIVNSDALILPGVGAFGEAMSNLKSLNLIDPIKELVTLQKKPILGICLGMQLLAESSEEKGNYSGLSFIKGKVTRIPILDGFRLPHIGWNAVEVMTPNPLFKSVMLEDAFYFVHSYQFEAPSSFVSSYTNYGVKIVSSVQDNNIFGVQFHPEKSQTAGLIIIKNFLNYVKESK